MWRKENDVSADAEEIWGDGGHQPGLEVFPSTHGPPRRVQGCTLYLDAVTRHPVGHGARMNVPRTLPESRSEIYKGKSILWLALSEHLHSFQQFEMHCDCLGNQFKQLSRENSLGGTIYIFYTFKIGENGNPMFDSIQEICLLWWIVFFASRMLWRQRAEVKRRKKHFKQLCVQKQLLIVFLWRFEVKLQDFFLLDYMHCFPQSASFLPFMTKGMAARLGNQIKSRKEKVKLIYWSLELSWTCRRLHQRRVQTQPFWKPVNGADAFKRRKSFAKVIDSFVAEVKQIKSEQWSWSCSSQEQNDEARQIWLTCLFHEFSRVKTVNQKLFGLTTPTGATIDLGQLRAKYFK